MNGIQRLIVIVSVGLFLLASLVPPWKVPHQDSTYRRWELLFTPPAATRGTVEIDWMMLIFEWLVILVAGVALLVAFRSPQPPHEPRPGGGPP